MSRRFLFFLLLASHQLHAQNTVTAYEYWFDADYANKVFQTIVVPQPTVTITDSADASALTAGLHTFNFRCLDDSNRWSVPVAQYIERLPQENSSLITGYEYWMDNDWQNKVFVSIAQPASVIQTMDSLDFSAVSVGLHSITIRYKQTDGVWSVPLTQYIEKLPQENSSLITGYEYWMDNDWQHKVSVAIAQPATVIQTIDSFDLSAVSVGLHSITIRYKQTDGVWSVPLTQYIERLPGTSEQSVITAYRYWNSDDTTVTTVALPNPIPVFGQLLYVNMLGIPIGDKQFNIQFKDDKGRWSAPLSDSVVNIGEAHLDAIVPNQGGNIGDVTATLYGGFFEGTHVMLVNAAGDTIHIPDSLVSINGGTDHFLATLDLRNKPLGLYDVVVTIPGDTVMKLLNGFEVVTGIEPTVETDVIGFNSARINQWTTYTLTYSNSGNVNAYNVPFWLAVPDNAETEIDFASSAPFDGVLDYDTVANYCEKDTLDGFVESVKVFGYIFKQVNANSTTALSVKVKTPSTIPYNIKTWINYRVENSPINPADFSQFADCMSSAIEKTLGVVPPVDCIYSAWDNIATLWNDAYFHPNPQYGTPSYIWDYTKSMTSMIVTCLGATGDLNLIIKSLSDFSSDLNLFNSCNPFFMDFIYQLPVSVVASYDPNEKLGPLGNGSQEYISNVAPLPYVIHFENADTATAAAQTVLVTDTLNQNVFDLSTLQLGFISFNDTMINLPSGLSNYEKLVDMRPKSNLIVEVKANLDQSSAILTWSFKTLDPVTLLPTTDPLLGFLPPNVTAPEGEGSVFFTIKVKDNVPLGTQIRNDASICFDNNPCMLTNEWSNTLDNTMPESQVNALPAITYDTTFQVSWSGNDTGSGVMQYNIFVATNGGAFKPWLVNTSATSQLFTGVLDSSYSFYSIAVDTAGNKELPPSNPDATTLIGLPTWLSNATIAENCTLFPNPNYGGFAISLVNPKKEKVMVSVFDAFGLLIYENQYPSSGSKQVFQIRIGEVPDGVYFTRIEIGAISFYKNLIVQK